MGRKKQGAKNMGHCYSKREETRPFFKVPDPKKISDRPDKLEYWVKIYWAIAFEYGTN